jgi:hypothetical protein
MVRMSASLATYIPPQIAEESASAKNPLVLAFTAGQSNVYGLGFGARSVGLSQSEWLTLLMEDDAGFDNGDLRFCHLASPAVMQARLG